MNIRVVSNWTKNKKIEGFRKPTQTDEIYAVKAHPFDLAIKKPKRQNTQQFIWNLMVPSGQLSGLEKCEHGCVLETDYTRHQNSTVNESFARKITLAVSCVKVLKRIY